MMDIFTIIAFVILIYLLIEEFGVINHGAGTILIITLALFSISFSIMFSYKEGININGNLVNIIANGAKCFMGGIFSLVLLGILINFAGCLIEELTDKINNIKKN